MILASAIGQIGHPFYVLFAQILAYCYDVIPNYAVAIAMLTLAVMIVVFPITLRGTRGMMKMQLLAPELKKLQNKYKATPGMTVAERQEMRQRQQQEMMAVYKENNVSPAGGCLPMVMQFPIFIILYGTVRGLIHQTSVGVGKHAHLIADPLYISHTSKIYVAIQHSNGQLKSFGLNLADSVRTSGLSATQKIPFIAMILVAIALQYIQMKQLSGRNPAAAAANPQMQQMQKVMPLIFAVIYISIPAAVNVYFIVSSLFRIAQQEVMYRRDPHIQASLAKLQARHKTEPKVVNTKVVKDRPAPSKTTSAKSSPAKATPAKATPARDGAVVPSKESTTPPPKIQPRARGKRQRKSR
jgi:YidC/Oxa1 family membrane protein insertase